jgi:hypothetical protein
MVRSLSNSKILACAVILLGFFLADSQHLAKPEPQNLAHPRPWVGYRAENSAWRIQFPEKPHIQESPEAPGYTFYVVGNDDILFIFATFVPTYIGSRRQAENEATLARRDQGGRSFVVNTIGHNGTTGYQLDYIKTISGRNCIVRSIYFTSSFQGTSFTMNPKYLICNLGIKNDLLPMGERFLNSLQF